MDTRDRQEILDESWPVCKIPVMEGFTLSRHDNEAHALNRKDIYSIRDT